MSSYRDMEAEHKEMVEAKAKAQAALVHDFMMTFSTEWGARVLKHLVAWGNVFAPTYVPGDPNASAFNEGIRNCVLYCLSMSDRSNLEDMRCLWKSSPPQGQQ